MLILTLATTAAAAAQEGVKQLRESGRAATRGKNYPHIFCAFLVAYLVLYEANAQDDQPTVITFKSSRDEREVTTPHPYSHTSHESKESTEGENYYNASQEYLDSTTYQQFASQQLEKTGHTYADKKSPEETVTTTTAFATTGLITRPLPDSYSALNTGPVIAISHEVSSAQEITSGISSSADNQTTVLTPDSQETQEPLREFFIFTSHHLTAEQQQTNAGPSSKPSIHSTLTPLKSSSQRLLFHPVSSPRRTTPFQKSPSPMSPTQSSESGALSSVPSTLTSSLQPSDQLQDATGSLKPFQSLTELWTTLGISNEAETSEAYAVTSSPEESSSLFTTDVEGNVFELAAMENETVVTPCGNMSTAEAALLSDPNDHLYALAFHITLGLCIGMSVIIIFAFAALVFYTKYRGWKKRMNVLPTVIVGDKIDKTATAANRKP